MKKLLLAAIAAFFVNIPALAEDSPKNYYTDAPKKVLQASRSVFRVIRMLPEGDEEVPTLYGIGSAVAIDVDYKTCEVTLLTAAHVVGYFPNRQLLFVGSGRAVKVFRKPGRDIALLRTVMTPCFDIKPLKVGKPLPMHEDLGAEKAFTIGFGGGEQKFIWSGDHQYITDNGDPSSEDLPTGWAESNLIFDAPVIGGFSGGALVDRKGRLQGILVGIVIPFIMLPVEFEFEGVTVYLPVTEDLIEELKCGEECLETP